MNKTMNKTLKKLIIAGVLTLSTTVSQACTGISLTAKDGTFVPARTMEFGVDLASNIIFVPRHYAYVGETPTGAGMKWKTKYAYVGANAKGEPIIADGVNEKGLYSGIFYLPGDTEYQAVTAANADKALAAHQLTTYLLGNFATVDEVKKALPNIVVSKAKFKPLNMMLPLHVRVFDATGKGIVVEYIGGELKVYDNWVGVLTNSPQYPWHVSNLGNYVNLMSADVESIMINGHKVEQTGEGSGMLGLPGDFTPPARFIRAVALSQSAYQGKDATETVIQAFHILNSFDIPIGAIRTEAYGKPYDDYTLWTTAVDTKNKKLYFHTHGNRSPKVVELAKFDFDSKNIVTIPMSTPQVFEDVSATRK